jgi:hypothetical protein
VIRPPPVVSRLAIAIVLAVSDVSEVLYVLVVLDAMNRAAER